MEPNKNHTSICTTTDANRPPQYDCGCNIGSGCRQSLGEGTNGAETRGVGALFQTAEAISRNGDYEGMSEDGDEGPEDHQQEKHIDAADLGHFRVVEVRRALARHHRCNYPACPHRMASTVKDWLRSAASRPETPTSMYAEPSSGERSMASSGFLEPLASPAHLIEAMGGWMDDHVARYPEQLNFIISPLWLVPEQIESHQPSQLDNCIPEESEPDEDGML